MLKATGYLEPQDEFGDEERQAALLLHHFMRVTFYKLHETTEVEKTGPRMSLLGPDHSGLCLQADRGWRGDRGHVLPAVCGGRQGGAEAAAGQVQLLVRLQRVQAQLAEDERTGGAGAEKAYNEQWVYFKKPNNKTKQRILYK